MLYVFASICILRKLIDTSLTLGTQLVQKVERSINDFYCGVKYFSFNGSVFSLGNRRFRK